MNQIKSIGLIETLGMVGAVEAADTALKAANVRLLGYELNRAGYVTIKLTGDVAAVKAAVASGAAMAQKLGNLIATHVIPRPDDQVIQANICTPDNLPPFPGPGKEKPKAEPVQPEKETRPAPDTKSDAKSDTKSESKSEAKQEGKQETKPAAKAEAPKTPAPKAKPVSKPKAAPKKKGKK